MDIRLIRRPHPNRMVRGSGITPTDPYLEWCWLPVAGPSTVALVRHVAELTSASGEARIALADLSRLLGLGAADVPSRNNKLVRTLTRAEQFGLAFTSLCVPGEQVTFGIHDHVAPGSSPAVGPAARGRPAAARGRRGRRQPGSDCRRSAGLALGRAGRLADP
jgi:hypothetical protein